MNSGYLSQYFEAVAAKKLSTVEVNPAKSNQHEFNGSKELKAVLRTTERTQFPTKFMYLEDQNAGLSEDGIVTWYDSRENQPHRSAEFRLFYPGNGVMTLAKPGDTMFIARRTDNTLLIIITPSDSTIERQLHWLFDLENSQSGGYQLSEIDVSTELDFAARFILEELEIEIEEPENDRIDQLLSNINYQFPDTLTFSNFARQSLAVPTNMIEEPDNGILLLMEWEEKLFKRLERYLVSKRLQEGFTTEGNEDVEGFLGFSLSVQNRRKSRAGAALENHLTYILTQNNIIFSRKAETENKAKPDFLFPNIECYRNNSFPVENLTLLGVKTSCKDRWRQVLSESEKIKRKNLLTLEPGISENQTNEMKAHAVELVIPMKIHSSFSVSQRNELLTLKDFIGVVSEKQKIVSQHGFLF